ncbi:MAG: hypothetical protein K0R27_3404 [Xanthobacteraceae bacterium]|nr:hypothetical protein [Xanthobacteraceae bacterium]
MSMITSRDKVSSRDKASFQGKVCMAESSDHSIFEMRFEVGDILVALALLAVAGLFWFFGAGIDDGNDYGIGAADFPRGLALLLAVASGCLLANAVVRLASGTGHHAICIGRPARVIAGMVAMIAFAPLMTRIGYYPAMAIFLAAMLWIADCRRPLHVVAYVAGFLIFSKVVFEMILSIPLP